MTELTDSSALAAVENFITDAGRMLLKIGATLLLTYVLALLSTLTVWRLTTRRSAAAATSKVDVEAEAPIEAEVPTKAEVPTEAGGPVEIGPVQNSGGKPGFGEAPSSDDRPGSAVPPRPPIPAGLPLPPRLRAEYQQMNAKEADEQQVARYTEKVA